MAPSPDFASLSKELQVLIVESCDMPTLYELCLTNRDMYNMSWPVLWRTIDFVNAEEQDDISEWQRRFFATCDILREDHSDRWKTLAPRVETLQLSRLAGPQISRQSLAELDACNESVFYCGPGQRTIFDIIADFTQLTTLSIFLKNDWDGPRDGADQLLRDRLTRLTGLRLGGQIDGRWLQALLHRPELLEHLSLINLVEQCGQDDGPDPTLFLQPLCNRFTRLRVLHLSKLGDMDLRDEYDEEPERRGLEEWVALLRSTSDTLVHLTIEICYSAKRRGKDTELEPRSEEQCRDLLLPVLLECEWPRLEELVIVGIDALQEGLRGEMPDRVAVKFRESQMVGYNWDTTPLEVSPPSEVFVD